MNVVGKFGSLIAQGVYSVATPIHPFGGAVDIIVVQQQDGSFRTTPWYVRFGKFQGVLKGAEKIVRIEVNGVEANFHMYLDNSGEAYFIREIVSGKASEGNDSPGSKRDDSSSIDYNDNDDGRKENVNHYRHEGNFSGKIEVLHDEHISLGVDRLERTESDTDRPFYEFHDEQSSLDDSLELSEYGSTRYDNLDTDSLVGPEDSNSEVVLVSVDGHILMAPISSSERNTDNMQLSIPQFHLGPGEGAEFCEDNADFSTTEATWATDYLGDTSTRKFVPENAEKVASDINPLDRQLEVHKGNEEDVCQVQETRKTASQEREDSVPHKSDDTSTIGNRGDIFKSCLELHELGLQVGNSNQLDKGSSSEIQKDDEDPQEKSPKSVIAIGEAEDESVGISIGSDRSSPPKSDEPDIMTSPNSQVEAESKHIETNTDQKISGSIPVHSFSNDQEPKEQNGGEHIQTSPQETAEPQTSSSNEEMKTDFRFEISLCGNLLSAGMGLHAAAEAFDKHRISEEEFKLSGASITKNENLVVRFQERYLTWENAAPFVLGMAAYGLDLPIESSDMIPVEQSDATPGLASTPGRRWRLWPIPFRRVKMLEHTASDSSEEVFVDTESGSQNQPAEPIKGHDSPHKQWLRTNIPTTEEIASLNLKEGQNMVNFIFSSGVLGKPNEVQAHIYLWKWNTRIVISDVDGTITKSDVLGQFMPLVGKDWTQSGVARLFSAIKENGYQLLFLSARAIVQAYLTRSFLVNLKQDGKALPNGPVVISPDGLFPSLYREVIRRAPHEFKIACLEDIKALFPSDYNPFYAGFGNRDTDELSYRKIGIPKGKIFIINPKGEVAISHRIDVKSYTSLHTLVNDMFPPTSMVEQEDYNQWNYWRMPLSDIDIE